MSTMVSQITGVMIVCSGVCSGADQIKHQSSALLAVVRGIHRWPVNSHHKGPVPRKMFPLDDETKRSKEEGIALEADSRHDGNFMYSMSLSVVLSSTLWRPILNIQNSIQWPYHFHFLIPIPVYCRLVAIWDLWLLHYRMNSHIKLILNVNLLNVDAHNLFCSSPTVLKFYN